jgi:hypothetical protein
MDILEEEARHGFVQQNVLCIDATYVKANAYKHKYVKQLIRQHLGSSLASCSW